ncbi:hypothetical protein, partial [Ligilactobacillus salivarius]|uniref:hypothetical protein n=1 Tax=Ligilactobacillus salivarius TaxID=1624 RepID=UPI001F33E3BB
TIRLSSNSLKIIIKILASVLFDKEPKYQPLNLKFVKFNSPLISGFWELFHKVALILLFIKQH